MFYCLRKGQISVFFCHQIKYNKIMTIEDRIKDEKL